MTESFRTRNGKRDVQLTAGRYATTVGTFTKTVHTTTGLVYTRTTRRSFPTRPVAREAARTFCTR